MDTRWRFLLGGLVAALLAFGPGQGWAADMEGPDEVELSSLMQVYGPVSFDHAMHAGAADSCAACHHHTTGDPTKDEKCVGCHAKSGEAGDVACQSCHTPPGRDGVKLMAQERGNYYHLDRTGLKRAYHVQCMGCHEREGAPTGCTDCHAEAESNESVLRSGALAALTR